MYQANTQVCRSSPTTCASADRSTGRNGPISFPPELMTPTVAAATRGTKYPVEVKAPRQWKV